MELGITWPQRQGHGFATEALSRVLDYAFGLLHKHRVTAVTDAENRTAAALFERLGFRREGHSSRTSGSRGGGVTSTCSPCCARSGSSADRPHRLAAIPC
jgi:RimJ/RimL family protein N-acetyltransferase